MRGLPPDATETTRRSHRMAVHPNAKTLKGGTYT